MMFDLTYQMTIAFSEAVRNHYFALRLLPRPDSGIIVHQQQLIVSAEHDQGALSDGFGNRLITGSLMRPHNALQLSLSARVERIAIPRITNELPASVYLPQSKLTQLDTALAQSWLSSTQGISDAYQLAQALSQQVFRQMTYSAGATHVGATVNALLAQPVGVCQDYAHILIALLRHHQIPARYVAGVTAGEGESHAWVEAWIDNAWLGFDPTHDCLVPMDAPYIAFAVGRDFSDCPLNTGSFIGNAQQTLYIQAQLTPC
jgi:transglutaminase-like putative cysteine protease